MKLTISGYAEYRGVTKQAVWRQVKSGRIQRVDDKIDTVAADQAWPLTINPQAKGTPMPEGPPADDAPLPPTSENARYNTARTEREEANAAIAQLKARELATELVQVAEVKRLWFARVRAARDLLLGLPDRIAADVAALESQHEVRVYLDRELRSVLSGLADADG